MSEGKYEVTVRPEKAAVVEEMKRTAVFPGRGTRCLQQTRCEDGYAAPPHIPEAWRAVQSY